jgi:hypothetical protein
MECISDDDRDTQDVRTLLKNPDEGIDVDNAAASGGGGALHWRFLYR